VRWWCGTCWVAVGRGRGRLRVVGVVGVVWKPLAMAVVVWDQLVIVRRRLGPVGGVDGVSEGPERLNACTIARTCVQGV